jgi:hypothetical protein
MLTSLRHVTSSAYLPYASGDVLDVVAVELISGLGLVGHLQVDSLGAALGGHIIRLPGISDCSLILSPLPPHHQSIHPSSLYNIALGGTEWAICISTSVFSSIYPFISHPPQA